MLQWLTTTNCFHQTSLGVSLCDVRKLHHNGAWACNHTAYETLCTLVSCPAWMEFEYPPEDVYTCDIQGQWLQTNIPKCISSKLLAYIIV